MAYARPPLSFYVDRERLTAKVAAIVRRDVPLWEGCELRDLPVVRPPTFDLPIGWTSWRVVLSVPWGEIETMAAEAVAGLDAVYAEWPDPPDAPAPEPVETSS